MSVLGDAVQTLNEDIEIAAFLPGVNYVFLHISTGEGSDQLLGLAIAASIVGAALFNYLRALTVDEATGSEEVSEDAEEFSQEWDDPRVDEANTSASDKLISQTWAARVLLLPWSALLLGSMYLLLERFPKNWILPEMLFFISLGFVSLYVMDAVLSWLVSGYSE